MTPPSRVPPRPALVQVQGTFRAFAATFVPEASDLDSEGWTSLEETVERALAERPGRVAVQLRLFMRVANLLPLLLYGRTFQRLPPLARAAFLKRLERAPLLLLRRGLWGLRTLVFLGYYGQPEVQRALGYRAHADGWRARVPWEERPVAGERELGEP